MYSEHCVIPGADCTQRSQIGAVGHTESRLRYILAENRRGYIHLQRAGLDTLTENRLRYTYREQAYIHSENRLRYTYIEQA